MIRISRRKATSAANCLRSGVSTSDGTASWCLEGSWKVPGRFLEGSWHRQLVPPVQVLERHVGRALLRSGRFERVLHVPPPDLGARESIFSIHSEGMPLSKFSLKDIIGGLDGFTGADIEAVCREAALICMRAKKKKVTKSHFEEAIKRVRPTVTPEMLDYYQKMETRLTSGLSNIKRNRDTSFGMESM